MNRPTTRTEIETVILKVPTNKSPRTDGFKMNSIKHLVKS